MSNHEDEIDTDSESIDDTTETNKIEKTFQVKVVAGTYDSTLCGWEFAISTQLDFDKMFDAKVDDEKDEHDDEKDDEKDDEQDEKTENKDTSEQDDKKDQDMDEDVEGSSSDEVEGVEFNELFAVRPHSGSVNRVTVFGQWMATGGYDENIVLYNVGKQKEEAVIHHMEGSITHLHLFEKFLFCSTTHGVVSIHEFSKHWEKIWQETAHKGGGCKHFAIHPSGRFMLTVGENDHKLKLWNLITGQLAYKINVGGGSMVVDAIHFSPSGDSYCVVSRDCFYVYDTESCVLIHSQTIKPQKQDEDDVVPAHLRVTCLKYLSEMLIVTGSDDKNLYVWNILEGKLIHVLHMHTNRVKDVDVMEIDVGEFILVSVDSDGGMALWRVSDEVALLEGFVDTGARLTSVALVKPSEVSKFVKQRYKLFKKKYNLEE
ncbi:p21-activated protein kinase-interacting protein 1 [Acrasis kona]|uniref:P21-activated protein kinase-interacting protein 1 n=1 Tax=Acrasis kona TaxID=1008807 RepID=A0AAW2YZ63_9EUKA